MNDAWLEGTIRSGEAATVGRGPLVKLGGSLLVRPSWPVEIAALVATLDNPVILVGGGAVVDGLRRLDAACLRPAVLMHELAIEALRLTGRLVADALGMAISPTIDHRSDPVVLDVAAWFTRHPAAGSMIPPGWEVTSDSIAAVVAATAGLDLLLAKSLPPPCPGDDLAGLAAAGWVDERFPSAAAAVSRIGWAAPAARHRPLEGS